MYSIGVSELTILVCLVIGLGVCNTRWFQYTVNPLLSPPGGLFISSPFEGGLNRDGGLI